MPTASVPHDAPHFAGSRKLERSPSSTRTAIIVGGGIAGLACALRLTDAGVRVTLLETRKKLGGRATSFKDVRTDRWLDNCQHVVLGCCTNYLDLLERLGVRDKIAWHRNQFWIEAGGRISILERGRLPAPGHFAASFLTADFLSVADKFQIARACARIMRVDRSKFRHQTFAEFLKDSGQSERVLRRFWLPVIVSACNLDVDRVSAAAALHVFQEGFLAHHHAADIGVPSVPLLQLYEAAESIIDASSRGTVPSQQQELASGVAPGGVHLGQSVQSIDVTSATTTDGVRLTADAIVCAVPVERVNRLISPELQAQDPRFAKLENFTHSPILGVHLSFDRPVLPTHAQRAIPHAVLVDRPTQWIFRKDDAGTQIHAVISAADAWIPLTEDQIAQRVLEDLHACIPSAKAARLLEVRAVKEKLATFAPVPGLEASRPAASGPSGIVLAGDYTDTGWPATMEGATRSGYTAAAAVLNQQVAAFVRPSLPVARLARVCGL